MGCYIIGWPGSLKKINKEVWGRYIYIYVYCFRMVTVDFVILDLYVYLH